MPPVGESGLGAYAREQIERARSDPRLARGAEAVVADFWQALEEAERTRMLGVLGLHELTHTLSRHEQNLGVKHTDAGLDINARSTLQAAWERAESARIELANGHPHLNAQAILSYCSALDAMVENLLKSWRSFRVMRVVDEMMATAASKVPAAAQAVDPEALDAIREVLTTRVAKKALGKAPALRDSGPDRYERLLAKIGLHAPEDRPLPQGLVDALTELNVLRNVLMHRAGRIDLPAMNSARTLSYKRGQLVRVDRDDYRRYSAAVHCYGQEITFRGIRAWPEVTDEADGPDLEGWEGYYALGA